MSNEIKMIYIGEISNNKNHYEIIEDKTHKIINVFYKNTRDKEVECWSLRKSEVEKCFGKDILAKTKSYWIYLSNLSKKERESESLTHLQVFPLKLWTRVIIPMKNGKTDNFRVESC